MIRDRFDIKGFYASHVERPGLTGVSLQTQFLLFPSSDYMDN